MTDSKYPDGIYSMPFRMGYPISCRTIEPLPSHDHIPGDQITFHFNFEDFM